MDAGYPCRHDEAVFSLSMGERKLMEHFVVVSIFFRFAALPR
jgi:hypothetical protein